MHNPAPVAMAESRKCEFSAAFAAEIGAKAVVPPDLRSACSGKEKPRPLRHGDRMLCETHAAAILESVRRKQQGEIQLGPSVDSPKPPPRTPLRKPNNPGLAVYRQSSD